MVDKPYSDSYLSDVKQVGRMFVSNGKNIPLDAEQFVIQCEQMCADEERYPNERQRGSGKYERNACIRDERDQRGAPKDCRVTVDGIGGERGHNLQDYIDLAASMVGKFGNYRIKRPCCSGKQCETKYTPCDSIKGRESLKGIDKYSKCSNGKCPTQ